ncbi:proline-rich protein 36-like [Brassica napus]|uniref:proline-rich protein 36-like n=1 Tax=Brassica napus TaxID=3708 RepID=UPI0006AA9324|nr:proline-rich protein 36-like [Brassica napus]
MENPWLSSARASALLPVPPPAGVKPSSVPPDPPDPASSFPLTHFPPLSSSSPKSQKQSKLGVSRTSHASKATNPTTESPLFQSVSSHSSALNLNFRNPRSTSTVHEKYRILLPKNSSPIQTNKASGHSIPPATLPNISPLTPLGPVADPSVATSPPSCSHDTPAVPAVSDPAQACPQPPLLQRHPVLPPAPKLVERIRKLEDKTLKRLAPITISETGRPTVLIPDAVFEKGAELHKDFIACYFNGRPPPIKQIQNFLNHISMDLCSLIGNAPVGLYSNLGTLDRCSVGSSSPRRAELVAGLVGDPKETDDFTKNLVSLTVSHVKVAVDLTKPVPDVVEFTRQSGEVVEVMVTYPWLPPTCSHCKELGHISKNGLQLPPQPPTAKAPNPKIPNHQTPKKINPKNNTTASSSETPPPVPEPTAASHTETCPDAMSVDLPPLTLAPISTPQLPPFAPLHLQPSLAIPDIQSPPFVPPPIPYIVALPAALLKPSLKRSRSHPLLLCSPPKSQPFVSPIPLSASFDVGTIPSTNITLSTSNSFSLLVPDGSLPFGQSSLSS